MLFAKLPLVVYMYSMFNKSVVYRSPRLIGLVNEVFIIYFTLDNFEKIVFYN